MNNTAVRSKWKQLKSKVQKQWGTPLFDDLELIDNVTDKRQSKIHKRLYSKESMERDYREWYSQS
ncbi:MAG: hypothetical protein K0S39_3458 [Paenibacillus sp.]|jgi:uncharacterized protein YjbJ (UPF0337 family)|nr:hypothetical protein [Paenibacillus sp.]